MRIEKVVNGQRINHVWDGSKQIVADIVEGDTYNANCYVRGTNLAAKYKFVNGSKSEYTYYTQNAHGDVVNLTDADGEVTKKYTYDAFGVEKNIDDSDANPFRYCGEYFDAETGTIYLRARYYNPTTGRFISRDSYAGKNEEPLSLNRYTYCHNNPVLYFDPSGHFKVPKWVKSVGNWFEERIDDWKVGAEEISDNVKETVVKNKDKLKKGATKIATFVVGKFSPLVKKINKFVNPTIKIFDSKNKADVLRVAHSANVINIGSGKEDNLFGVNSGKKDKYIEHCRSVYDTLTCDIDYEYIAENSYTWDQLDSEIQKSIVGSMIGWNREYYYNTATYIAAENIDDATKIIWRSAGLFG